MENNRKKSWKRVLAINARFVWLSIAASAIMGIIALDLDTCSLSQVWEIKTRLSSISIVYNIIYIVMFVRAIMSLRRESSRTMAICGILIHWVMMFILTVFYAYSFDIYASPINVYSIIIGAIFIVYYLMSKDDNKNTIDNQ